MGVEEYINQDPFILLYNWSSVDLWLEVLIDVVRLCTIRNRGSTATVAIFA